MSKIFITGDRSAGNLYPALVTVELLKAVKNGDEIVTGDNGGVEALVRWLAEAADVHVDVMPTPVDETTGKGDWDKRHKLLQTQVNEVIAIHVDPLSSRIVKSAMDVFSDDGLRLVSTVDVTL